MPEYVLENPYMQAANNFTTELVPKVCCIASQSITKGVRPNKEATVKVEAERE